MIKIVLEDEFFTSIKSSRGVVTHFALLKPDEVPDTALSPQ